MAAMMMKSASVTMKPLAKVPAAKANQMMVWRADNNKQFETFSFLPPLTKEQIAKQIDYIVNNGWVPCLEFSEPDLAYVANTNTNRLKVTPGYYDNRYWTMWKLPMFGCTDPSQVLAEIAAAAKALPDAYVRVAAFDNVKQVQIVSFLAHRPASAKEYRVPSNRQIS